MQHGISAGSRSAQEVAQVRAEARRGWRSSFSRMRAACVTPSILSSCARSMKTLLWRVLSASRRGRHRRPTGRGRAPKRPTHAVACTARAVVRRPSGALGFFVLDDLLMNRYFFRTESNLARVLMRGCVVPLIKALWIHIQARVASLASPRGSSVLRAGPQCGRAFSRGAARSSFCTPDRAVGANDRIRGWRKRRAARSASS